MARVIINANSVQVHINKVPMSWKKDYELYINKKIPEKGIHLYCFNTVTENIERAFVRCIDGKNMQYAWEEIK